jgi:hypothetical protein
MKVKRKEKDKKIKEKEKKTESLQNYQEGSVVLGFGDN